MSYQKQLVSYSDSQKNYQGLLVQKAGTQAKATILISPTWEGRGEFVEHIAERLCDLGYQAFCIDMYGDGITEQHPAKCEALMKPLVENRAELESRITLALDTIKKHPDVNAEKIIAIGYCFGGLCVLDLARSGAELLGVVSFHGLLHAPKHTPQEKSEDIKASILVLHGHDDPMVPVEQVNDLKAELTQLQADWQLHAYGNTVHAFTNKNARMKNVAFYNELSDRRSWQSMVNFFDELLQRSPK